MATAQWGRKETIIWPPQTPIYTWGAVFLSIVAAGLFLYLRFSFALTPLQQFYLPYYLRTQVAGVMHKTDKYQLLIVSDGQRHARVATEEDVQKGSTPEASGKTLPLQLSSAARAAGLRFLYRVDHRFPISISRSMTGSRAPFMAAKASGTSLRHPCFSACWRSPCSFHSRLSKIFAAASR